MMSTAPKRNKNRTNNSGATRGGRQRNYNDNRNTIITDGVFANPRFTHLATSLIGCVVQLQVKNGGIYEGVLKTFSPRMDVVLEMAHKCEDMGNNNNGSMAYVPPRDRLIEKILFNVSDILSICASNVDLDYAVKDSFTDSAISKSYNGQVGEKDLRELTPWEGGDGEDLGLEGDPANGWDPNEMFLTNEKRFDVRSTYDESLKQYTTQLDKTDSSEYRAREEKATKIANEIEKSDTYKSRIALENGDGDEEDKFSAVKRTNENNTGKYIHPNRRNQHQQHLHQQNRNLRTGAHIANHNHHNLPNRMGGPQVVPQSNVQQPPPPRITSPPTQPTIPVHHPPPVPEEAKLNNIDKEDRRSEVTEPIKTSPVPENMASSPPEKPDSIHSPVSNKVDRRNSNPRGRQVITEELKEFQSNFNLADGSKEKEEKEKSQERKEPDKIEETIVVEPERQEEKQDTETAEKDPDETLKKSNLNPNAKVFVFNPHAKPFQPKQQTTFQQNPTPPRPQTQSPIIQPMPAANIHFQTPGMSFMLPPGMSSMPQQQVSSNQPPMRQTKRAIVSIQGPRQDLTAAAAQATGSPLLASHIQAPQYQVMQIAAPPMMPQPTGYQMGQVMPMPSATAAGAPSRMVPPTSVAMVPTSHHGAVDHPNQSHSAGPLFMTPNHTGPVPAHMHQQFSHPNPAHMGPPQNQHSGQMNPQANTHHPAPSPTVQQQGPSQSHTQGHPPTSGTPQPQPQYHNISIQGHPTLQASPHNPASPQTMHAMPGPFHFTSHAAAHVNPGNQQFSMTQAHINPPSSGSTHNMAVQSPHLSHGHGPPQIVMMPHPNQVPQAAPQQQQPHGHQFQQPTPVGPHMAGQHRQGPGQGPVLQATVQGLQGSNPTNMQPPNLPHFVPQVHSQGGPPVQSYPQNH